MAQKYRKIIECSIENDKLTLMHLFQEAYLRIIIVPKIRKEYIKATNQPRSAYSEINRQGGFTNL